MCQGSNLFTAQQIFLQTCFSLFMFILSVVSRLSVNMLGGGLPKQHVYLQLYLTYIQMNILECSLNWSLAISKSKNSFCIFKIFLSASKQYLCHCVGIHTWGFYLWTHYFHRSCMFVVVVVVFPKGFQNLVATRRHQVESSFVQENGIKSLTWWALEAELLIFQCLPQPLLPGNNLCAPCSFVSSELLNGCFCERAH